MSDMLLAVEIRALDFFTGPLRSMISSVTAAEGKFKTLNNAMKMMGKSRAEIDAINASLTRMGDQKAFANMASDLQRVGMARQDIAAMESSYMRMAQYQRDMAAAQAEYTAGRDLAMSGVGNLATGAFGAFGLFEMVKKAGEFQANMTVIQDSTGASTKQMQAFGDAVMNTSAAVSKFNDMQVSQIAQKLTSGGFSNIKQAQSLLLPVSKYAEVQMYEHKSSDALQSTQQAIEMAHVFKNYDPKSFENFLNDFNKYSMMQPGDSSSLVQTLTYLAPKAQTLGMSQSDILGLSAVANRVGLTGSHGGTNAADMILRLIPGLVGGGPTKKGTPKAWAAMEKLGFVDKNGNSPFFDKNGKIVNLNGMLTTMINDGKKLNNKDLTQAYHDIFGSYGGNAASILANKTTLEQLTQMRKQLGHTKSMEQINADLQKTPEGQLNLLKSNGMSLMLRVGQQLAMTLNPAIASINKLLGSMLKFSEAHPGVAKVIGDFALLSVGMVTTTGIVKIFAGSFKMLKGAFGMLKLTSEAGELTKFGAILTSGPLLAGIAAVAAGGYLIYKNWGTVGPFLKKIWSDLKNLGQGLFMIFTGTGGGKGIDLLQKLGFSKNTISGLMKIAGSIPPIINQIKTTVGNAAKSVWTTLTSAWGGIVSFVKSIWPQVMQITRTVWPIISTIVTTYMKNVWIEIKTVGTIIGATFKALWTALVPVVQTTWNLFRDIIKTEWDYISGLIKIGLDLLTGNWKKAWTDLKTTTSSLWKDVGKIFTDGWNGIKKIASGWKDAAFQWGSDIVSGLVNGITGMFGNAQKAIESLGGNISKWFKGVVKSNSPSKVFMGHGKDIVHGLALGIDRNAGMAHKSTVQLANGVNKSFNSNSGVAVGGSGAVEIHIHPHPHQRAEDIAELVIKKMGKVTRRNMMNAGTTVNMGAF
ncbi:phage tail tape measure protein [Bacillus sp. BRMEA1]|uniref:phage tail tape measure protein n=1 Tax=Neobacillus endophyticus TaxID=2738405 RepID=UPI001566A5B4|nr:phage tail tape measure protein [Neobacillus endophyticus]NRD81165.1 phage tail tape measure protein [Neobacillus endophyticus]